MFWSLGSVLQFPIGVLMVLTETMHFMFTRTSTMR